MRSPTHGTTAPPSCACSQIPASTDARPPAPPTGHKIVSTSHSTPPAQRHRRYFDPKSSFRLCPMSTITGSARSAAVRKCATSSIGSASPTNRCEPAVCKTAPPAAPTTASDAPALVVGDRMNLIHNHSLDIAQDGATLVRGKKNVERLPASSPECAEAASACSAARGPACRRCAPRCESPASATRARPPAQESPPAVLQDFSGCRCASALSGET